MNNKIKSIVLAASAAAILFANISVFATSIPQKTTGSSATQQQYDEETQKIIETITGGKSSTTATQQPTEKPTATPKATQKASSDDEETTSKATATPKATAKATSKATATPKATAKTSSKATATPKATAKSSTVATVKPSEDADYENNNRYSDEEDDVITATANEIVLSPSPDPSINVVTNQEQLNTKRYLTKGGAFGMFILTVLVSAVVSFLISYRFYKMNRTDSRVMAEIRALKRDIDTKMTGTVGGFSEHETRTSNTNPSYARDRAITRRTTDMSSTDNAQDMYAKWESQIGSRNRTAQQPEERPVQRNSEYTQRTRARAASRKKQTTVSKIKEAIDAFINKK